MFNFFQLLRLFCEKSLMNLLLIFLFILFLLSTLFFLFENRCSVRYPFFFFLHLAFFNILFHNTIIFSIQSLQIKYVKNVINFVMIYGRMLLKSFKLKIDIESLLTTNVAKRFLVLFYLFWLLTKLWKFVNNCTWKYTENNHLSQHYITNL